MLEARTGHYLNRCQPHQMLKHTKKDICSCAKCSLTDAGGNKPRSKKFADRQGPRFVAVKPDLPRFFKPLKPLPRVTEHREYTGADGLVRTQEISLERVWVADRSDLPFNTSAQPAPKQNKGQLEKTLQNRARSKYITNVIAVPLASIASPLENSYKTTLRCSGSLSETSGKLTGLYCGQRWCVVCSRIRTARMIAGYLPQLEEMQDKWFLTLTRKNVPASLLPETITEMVATARLINRNLKQKKGYKFNSLRKLECTYNAVDREYHPHFHFIFDSERAARAYLQQWIDRHAVPAGQPVIVDPQGQDLKPADNASVKELFKYFTKIATGKKYDKKTGKVVDYGIHIGPMDVMFQAMRGKRVFQPCGLIKAVSEEIEAEFALPTERDLTACYSWMGNDWIDRETGNVLCGYEPSITVKEIASHIVMPKKRTIDTVDLETGEIKTEEVTRFGEMAPALPDALEANCTVADVVPDWMQAIQTRKDLAAAAVVAAAQERKRLAEEAAARVAQLQEKDRLRAEAAAQRAAALDALRAQQFNIFPPSL